MGAKTTASRVVEAAGGVVHRSRNGTVEVLVVHRPKYDDWSLPKGKREPGESLAECALREVQEETGYSCSLGKELAGTGYADRHGRDKTVRYWAMRVDSGKFVVNNEVDEVRWLAIGRAAKRLTYARDADVLRSFAERHSG